MGGGGIPCCCLSTERSCFPTSVLCVVESHSRYKIVYAIHEYQKKNLRWINLISHSMGVTIARKIVKGGRIAEDEGCERHSLS